MRASSAAQREWLRGRLSGLDSTHCVVSEEALSATVYSTGGSVAWASSSGGAVICSPQGAFGATTP